MTDTFATHKKLVNSNEPCAPLKNTRGGMFGNMVVAWWRLLDAYGFRAGLNAEPAQHTIALTRMGCGNCSPPMYVHCTCAAWLGYLLRFPLISKQLY